MTGPTPQMRNADLAITPAAVGAQSTTAQRTNDAEARSYDPAKNDYDLAKDPRCLWGWGPPSCRCSFGHACFRAFGHPGKCVDGGERREGDLPCAQRQRPKDWDAHGRAEANR